MSLHILIQVVPPNGNGGSNLTLRINPHKFNYLKKELGDKIFIVYEDERSVILAGFNGSSKPKIVKVPKAWLFSDIKALVSVIPHR